MERFEPAPEKAHAEEDLSDAELASWLADIEATGVPGERRTGAARLPAAFSIGLQRLLDDPVAPVTPPEVLAATSTKLQSLVADRVSEGTRAAYEADWAAFDRWCGRRYRLDAIDATALVVGEYVAEMVSADMAMSTIRRRLSALRHNFEAAGQPSPTGDLVVRAAVDGARRRGKAAHQAIPLSLGDMRAIVSGLPIVAPNRPTMRRDQLLVGLGWAGALRPGELVGIDVDNVHIVGDPEQGNGGALIWLRSAKRAPAGRWVAIPFSTQQWSTCPVRRFLGYVKGLARPERSGPLFRHIDRHGKPHGRLTRRSVTPVVRRCVVEVLQLAGAGYQANSLRAGLVTECRDRGVDDRLIALQTGHAIAGERRAGGILNVYDRPLDLLKRNALDPSWW